MVLDNIAVSLACTMTLARSSSLLLATAVLLLVRGPPVARGHGMLLAPVNRGSMWRAGYNTPANYDDNAQYCGGRDVQWSQNGGHCGECGDNWALARPRPSENGGLYGTGKVVARYTSGQVITATAKITANHLGGFEFRLCPLASPSELETEECFAKHPLQLATGGGEYYQLPSSSTGNYSVELRLPAGVTCELCVLQWTYITANSWGVCADGVTGALGCGPQEWFRTCSDIAID